MFDLSTVFDSNAVFASSAVLNSMRCEFNAVLNSVQSGHLLERLFEQELRYTLGPTVRQEYADGFANLSTTRRGI